MYAALFAIGPVWNDPQSIVAGALFFITAVLAVTLLIVIGSRTAGRQSRAAAEWAAASEELDKGSAAIHAGDPDLALSHANELLRRWPDKSGGQLLRAEALCRKGQFRRALDDANDVVHRAPSPAAFRIRGEIHLGLEDYDRAIADFSDAMRLCPEGKVSAGLRAEAYARQAAAEKDAEERRLASPECNDLPPPFPAPLEMPVREPVATTEPAIVPIAPRHETSLLR